MIETTTVCYGKFKLHSRCFYNNKDNVAFTLTFQNQISEKPLPVFTCTLNSLFNHELGFQEGDYYQAHINRLEGAEILEPGTSLGKIFHEILKGNRNDLPFIKNIYSSAINSSDGFSESAFNFWNKQLENGLAIKTDDGTRFKALI